MSHESEPQEVIPFAKPCIGPDAVEAVKNVLESGWIMQGPKVGEFEALFAEYCGVKEAVAVSSGTAALHLALAALELGPGDEVICPSLSFIATANAVVATGATPVFADADPSTLNLDADAVEALITARTKAIVVVHQLGLPADIDAFVALGEKHGLKVVEDAACALGSRYKGERIGGHTEMAAFSFHPRKTITTGEGGMITTNSSAHAERLRLLRQHGMNMSTAERHGAGRVVLEQYVCIGYNYRLTDLQAAIGIEQMGKLEWILAERRRVGRLYDAAFAEHPWARPVHVPPFAEWNYQSYPIRLLPEAPIGRNDLMQHLLRHGISTRRGVMLAHTEPAYSGRPCVADLSRSEQASACSLLLPMFPELRTRDVERVLGAFAAVGDSSGVPASRPGDDAEP